MYLEQNLKGLCKKSGIDFNEFLSDLNVESALELSVFDLQSICEEYQLDLLSLIFKPLFNQMIWKNKLKKIKLLVLDIDGVMTDGGMYYTEKGDQIKKYNTKDGMAIQHLTKKGFQVAIISSGYTIEMVKSRAELLGIQFHYVGREEKLSILKNHCQNLNIELDEVAIIGDDINDMQIIKNIGFSACPADAVNAVKTNVDLVLTKKGGEGCVREFIDNFILEEALS